MAAGCCRSCDKNCLCLWLVLLLLRFLAACEPVNIILNTVFFFFFCFLWDLNWGEGEEGRRHKHFKKKIEQMAVSSTMGVTVRLVLAHTTSRLYRSGVWGRAKGAGHWLHSIHFEVVNRPATWLLFFRRRRRRPRLRLPLPVSSSCWGTKQGRLWTRTKRPTKQKKTHDAAMGRVNRKNWTITSNEMNLKRARARYQNCQCGGAASR